MERKIGEIFEFKKEYYQVCLDERGTCKECSLFQNSKCVRKEYGEYADIIGDCLSDKRRDNKDVHFKKLPCSTIIKPSILSLNPKKKLLLIFGKI